MDELKALGYEKIEMPLFVDFAPNLEKSIAFNDEEIKLDPDSMYVRFIMCHEGPNANGDYFTKEVLQRAQFTPKFKPINWEHSQPIIGTILGSRYAEDNEGRGYIEAYGAVWKFIYKDLSEQIKQKAVTGELKLSMECWYKEANYMHGDNLYDQQQAEELGLVDYVGREYMGKKVYRVFKDVLFGGVGVVANPADREAVFLSVARDLKNNGITLTPDGSISIDEAVANSISRPVNDFTVKQDNQEVTEAKVLAQYIKAFDKAKSAIVDKFNKEDIKAKQQLIADVDNVLATLISECRSISRSYQLSTAEEEPNKSQAELSLLEIHERIAGMLFRHYAENFKDVEAYLVKTFSDHFIFEIFDYSKPYPESYALFKGYYSIEGEDITLDLQNIVRVKQDYVEIEDEKAEGSEVKEMENIKANELEDVKDEAQVDCCGKDDCEHKQVQDNDNKAEAELMEKVSKLQEELDKANATIETLTNKVKEYEARFSEIEANKLAEARLAELKEVGIEFSEARLEKELAKLKGMSDEEFADYKELLVEIAKANKADEEQVEQEQEEVEVEVEGSATAGLNIELETKKEVKPFSHLG